MYRRRGAQLGTMLGTMRHTSRQQIRQCYGMDNHPTQRQSRISACTVQLSSADISRRDPETARPTHYTERQCHLSV